MSPAFRPSILVTIQTADGRSCAVAGRTPLTARLWAESRHCIRVFVRNRAPVELTVHKCDDGWQSEEFLFGAGVCLAFDPENDGIYCVDPRHAPGQLTMDGLPAARFADGLFVLCVPGHHVRWVRVPHNEKPVPADGGNGLRIAPPGFEPGTS